MENEVRRARGGLSGRADPGQKSDTEFNFKSIYMKPCQ
jgi:hypothetical protein